MNLLLTGGHSGIGLELSKRLLKEGHHLGLVIRNEKRATEVREDLSANNDQVDFFYADLSKSEEVKKVAQDISNSWDQVDGLFNNAGVLLDKAYYSDRGNEMHFEVNTLAPYELTLGLKDKLTPGGVVVNTVTGGLHRQKSLNIDEPRKPTKFVKLLGSYMHSKLALALMMKDLAGKWPEVRIVNADPGPNKTKMTADTGMPGWLKPIRNLLFPGPEKGGAKLYDAAFDSSIAGLSGIYYTGGSVKPMKFQLTESEIESIIS